MSYSWLQGFGLWLWSLVDDAGTNYRVGSKAITELENSGSTMLE